MVSIMTKLLILVCVVIIVPLSILGIVAVNDAQNIGLKAVENAQRMGNSTITNSIQTVTNLIGDSFIRQGNVIADRIVTFLEEREMDTITIANILADCSVDTEQIETVLLNYYNSKQLEWWYNENTDLSPVEKKEMLPVYTQLAFIDNTGLEISKVIDGELVTDLKDVSTIENTEFLSEDYFEKTKLTSKGDVYVSRVNTWYISTSEARKDLPEDLRSGSAWNILPGRDLMKTGNIKFATPVYKDNSFIGIVVLSVDYRHIQSLTKHIDPANEDRVVSNTYEGNYILFFDDQGYTIVHPKPNNIRGYTINGTLEHTNTVETPGGIFNLKDYNKNDAYKTIYQSTILNKNELVRSAVDVKGRNKMTITVPVFYDKGEFKDSGVFGGLMMSVNTDNFYESSKSTEMFVAAELQASKENIMLETNTTMYKIIGITLLAILIGILFGIFFARSIIDPIKKITKVAMQVADGNLDAELPSIKNKDEVSDLSDTMALLIGAVKFLKREK